MSRVANSGGVMGRIPPSHSHALIRILNLWNAILSACLSSLSVEGRAEVFDWRSWVGAVLGFWVRMTRRLFV